MKNLCCYINNIPTVTIYVRGQDISYTHPSLINAYAIFVLPCACPAIVISEVYLALAIRYCTSGCSNRLLNNEIQLQYQEGHHLHTNYIELVRNRNSFFHILLR